MKTILRITGRVFFIIVLTVILLAVIAVLFLNFYPSVGKSPDRNERAELDKKSKRYYNGQFHNENEVSTMTGKRYPVSERKTPPVKLPAEIPEFRTDPQADTLCYTWFGHSSFLLQMGMSNILVDPVFSDRSSPLGFIGPKRFSELPVSPEELPEIDVLFISHDHYDHLDYQTIRAIREKVGVYIVPLGVDAILRGWDVAAEKIHALDWWESIEINGLVCTLTPSQHFTGRNPLKGNSTLWGGLYLSNDFHRVYYTGDGGYCEVFGEVGDRLGTPELMIAECGQYDPAWARIHMFPEETVQAGIDAGTEWMIPVHWGSFSICNHAWDDSIRRVTAEAEFKSLRLATPKIGQTMKCADIASFRERWWEVVNG